MKTQMNISMKVIAKTSKQTNMRGWTLSLDEAQAGTEHTPLPGTVVNTTTVGKKRKAEDSIEVAKFKFKSVEDALE